MTEKLAVKNPLYNHWRDVEKIIADAVLNFGKCSSVYLMRKIKCSEEEAEKLMSLYEENKFLRDFFDYCEERSKKRNMHYQTYEGLF